MNFYSDYRIEQISARSARIPGQGHVPGIPIPAEDTSMAKATQQEYQAHWRDQRPGSDGTLPRSILLNKPDHLRGC
jgi:hypothetical protein